MSTVISIEEFNGVKHTPMLFILGKERSGTTLLQTLLDTHPNIVGPPESKFVLLLYPRFGNIKKWGENEILSFIEELYKEPWISTIWKPNRELLTSNLLSVKEHADYASICKLVYYSMRGNKENILWLSDKNPVYALFVNPLLKIFPEAKFIHLVREPRDNVYSHLKSFGVKNTRFIAQKWLAYNDILIQCKKQFPQKFFTQLYENMVGNPETSMKELCKFLPIPYDDKMIHNSFPERLESFGSEKLVMDRVQEVHSNLLKPVNTSNIGKWKAGMSSEEVKIVEAITGKFAAKNFNYEMSEDAGKISFMMRLRIAKTKIIYYVWQMFTRAKYKSYWFNMFYTKLNIFLGRETGILGK